MSKTILVCISGTGQETSDAEDDAIDNPLKIAVRAGWRGHEKPCAIEGQHVIYVPGVGTKESQKIIDGDSGLDARLEAKRNAVFAPKEAIAARGEYMRNEIVKVPYGPGDIICLVGFSRGAAESRLLASSLSKDDIPVRMLCCFDTVAQIGGPDKDQWPDDEVLFENNSVAASVEEAIHLVSIDENRALFPPTLMDHDDKVHEVWFAGVHSDAGGGYAEHELSDVTLGYMLERMREADIIIEQPETITDFPEGIDQADIAFNPDPLAEMHQHKVGGAGKRVICVIDSGRPSRITPLVYEGVKARMDADPSYSIGDMFEWNFVK